MTFTRFSGFSYTGSHFIVALLLLLFSGKMVAAAQCFHTEDSQQHTEVFQKVVIGRIELINNKVTKKNIILRELTFRSGDTLLRTDFAKSVAQSRNNLLNTALFNFVEVDTVFSSTAVTVVDISFRFVERWYLWPIPVVAIADRNFNEWWETKDLSRINYGMYLNHRNFRGRRELLQALAVTGYNQSFAINYLKPNINRSQTVGLGLSAMYRRSHEITYETLNDKLSYIDDASTFMLKMFESSALFYYRPQIHQSHSIWLKYSTYSFSDTIYALNPDFFISRNTAPFFMSLIYEFRSDHRNLKYYPTTGYYFDLRISKHGLGFLQNSKMNVFDISTNYKRYIELNPRCYLLTGATVLLSLADRQPYFMSTSLGYYYSFIRGYEYYVIDGRHTGLGKVNLKYQLLRPTNIHLRFIPTEKFSRLHLALYLGLHSDFGYVYEPNDRNNLKNKLPNTLLWGNGVGFDVVTYYDWVMRMEYSVNRKGEHGFFLHFLAPI